MINVFYDEKLNIDLGLLNYLHPFDGMKFKKIYKDISNNHNLTFHSTVLPISLEVVNEFVNELIGMLITEKVPVMRALEIPFIPFVKFSYLDRKVLLPMRYGVNNTLKAAELALAGHNCWNLADGYHHASQHSMEGFCIYNDIGIAYQELIKSNKLMSSDKLLIIDTDAHHGNGNARTFMDNDNVTILDVYNESIYPSTYSTRERVDLPVPMPEKVTGNVYLTRYQKALNELTSEYKVAFVVAGTDVLKSDKLGGMSLSVEDVIKREVATFQRLQALEIPVVFLGGGGYSGESALAVSCAINKLSEF